MDKYTWVDFGDSYLPSELNAAYLWAQLQRADEINEDRLATWDFYYSSLKPLAEEGRLELPMVPEGCDHNAHMFYLKLGNIAERTKFISYMKEQGVYCVFHYIPLHSAPAGLRFGRFHGEDKYTTMESERLVRMPIYYGILPDDLKNIVKAVYAFFKDEEI